MFCAFRAIEGPNTIYISTTQNDDENDDDDGHASSDEDEGAFSGVDKDVIGDNCENTMAMRATQTSHRRQNSQ